MRTFATHRPSPGRVTPYVALLLLVTCFGCPLADPGGVDVDRAVLLNGAADTVLVTMSDAIDNGQVEINDDMAAAIVTPEPGATVARATPFKFAWSVPSGKPADGGRARGTTTSGEFVWLQLSGGGLARNIDVLAVGVSSWTPTAAEWAEISAATGPVTITLTNALLNGGVLQNGPYRATAPSTFAIAP